MHFGDVEYGRHDPRTPWDDPEWRSSAVDWVRSQLAALGLTTTDSPSTIRLRPWSVILRIPVAGSPDPVWFKANPPASRFEPALAALLGRHRPDDVVAPLALDADRGWSLQPHGGEVFRATLEASPAASVADWEPVVRQYAEFQRSLAPLSEEIAALGVPRLTAKGISEEALARLEALCPGIGEMYAELETFGIGEALDHADLHDNQILGPGRDGRFRFFDWGDAAIAHPFSSMLVTTRVARSRFGADCGVERLHDAYLEVWEDTGLSRAELRQALRLACRTAAVARVLVWNRVFPGNADGTAGWAEELAGAGDFG